VTVTAYLSLGSNIGDRAGNLREAIERLRSLGEVGAVSSLYETEPIEYTEQPWFVNCAVKLETSLTATQLLGGILEIEKKMGRHREKKKGPRNIDLDILLYGDRIVDGPELTIPHPAMHERRFVLVPLAEIAPEVKHLASKKTVRELLQTLGAGQVVKKITAQ
jgi:2-amino-4-hydroxy-6-hydroxymethyldihydropteridine diphosphokinase